MYSDTFEVEDIASNKALRDHEFNKLLIQRTINFSLVSGTYTLPRSIISSEEMLMAEINNTQFHETFHHSEQAFMHYISSPAGIENIVSFARLSNAQYVYGLIVDIYTERMLCNNCNAGLIGMQHSPEKGFIFERLD